MDYVIAFAIMLSISVVILIVSMIITSSLMAGIDFGQLHIVVAKALPLLIAVNLVSLLPFGFLIALIVWAIGLMYLFGLDFAEARVLIVVNWLLNLIARLIVFAAVMHAS